MDIIGKLDEILKVIADGLGKPEDQLRLFALLIFEIVLGWIM